MPCHMSVALKKKYLLSFYEDKMLPVRVRSPRIHRPTPHYAIRLDQLDHPPSCPLDLQLSRLPLSPNLPGHPPASTQPNLCLTYPSIVAGSIPAFTPRYCRKENKKCSVELKKIQ